MRYIKLNYKKLWNHPFLITPQLMNQCILKKYIYICNSRIHQEGILVK